MPHFSNPSDTEYNRYSVRALAFHYNRFYAHGHVVNDSSECVSVRVFVYGNLLLPTHLTRSAAARATASYLAYAYEMMAKSFSMDVGLIVDTNGLRHAHTAVQLKHLSPERLHTYKVGS